MKKHRPNLKEKDLFALRDKDGCFVVNSLPLRFSKNPSEARRFTGGYLNVCIWDWSFFLEAVPIDKLPKRPQDASKAKGAVKGSLTRKHSAIALLCALTLSASAAPVTRIRGPVRITSWRPLANYYYYERSNTPNYLPPRVKRPVGLVARPIKYRPIKGAETE